MSNILENSIWPNNDGELGKNKVKIPDNINDKWPDGDAFIDNFIYKNGKLAGFVDTKALINNDSSETGFDYDYVDISLESIDKDSLTINKGPRCKRIIINGQNISNENALVSFSDLSSDEKYFLRSATKIIDNVLYDANDNEIGTYDTSRLTSTGNMYWHPVGLGTGDVGIDGKPGDALFWPGIPGTFSVVYKNISLTYFNSSLENVTNGAYTLDHNNNITTFISNMPNLIDGDSMASSCKNLVVFDCGPLSNLVTGESMFMSSTNLDGNTLVSGLKLDKLEIGNYMFNGISSITSFTSNLPNLITANNMFSNTSLKAFNIDMPSLVFGSSMFINCRELDTFSSDLRSLITGSSMFAGCKLSPESISNIYNSINNLTTIKQLYSNGTIPYVTQNETTGEYSATEGFMANGDFIKLYCASVRPAILKILNSRVGDLEIGIDINKNTTTLAQDLQTFAEQAGFSSWENLKQSFSNKGWTVTWTYANSSSNIS